MFWKKKKVEDSLEQLDKDKWLKDLLVELDLINIDNLIGVAEIEKSRRNKEATEKLLRYIQPFLLKGVKEGKTWIKTPELKCEELKNILPEYDEIEYDKLKKFRILVQLDTAIFSDNLERGYFFRICLLKEGN